MRELRLYQADWLVRFYHFRAGLATLRIPLQGAMPFIVTADHTPTLLGLDAMDLRDRVAPRRQQLDLFAIARSAAVGELGARRA